MGGAATAAIAGLLQRDRGWGIGTPGPAAPVFLATSVPYATLGCNGVSHLARIFAQFRVVCRRSGLVSMGTRRHRRGAPIDMRWALQWRGDGQLLGQC